MSKKPRDYGFRDEEVPAVADFTLSSLKRDLVDFTAFSPKYDDAFVTDYEGRIESATELVSPKTETARLKMLTQRLYDSMQSLIMPLASLEIYLGMANGQVNMSTADFGISTLRKAVHSRNAEQTIKNLSQVTQNIALYKDSLTAQGLTEEQITAYATTGDTIKADNKQQHEIISNRRATVDDNVGMLNDLYADCLLICKIGKALYKESKPVKLPDYTIDHLLSEVRHRNKKDDETEAENNEAETTA